MTKQKFIALLDVLVDIAFAAFIVLFTLAVWVSAFYVTGA